MTFPITFLNVLVHHWRQHVINIGASLLLFHLAIFFALPSCSVNQHHRLRPHRTTSFHPTHHGVPLAHTLMIGRVTLSLVPLPLLSFHPSHPMRLLHSVMDLATKVVLVERVH
jgi:hypothetical protein